MLLREAWENEATEFTPWLAQEEHVKILGDELGLALEVDAQERRVGPFLADILCKNTDDRDSLVLIKNQLKRTDHTYLGRLQIVDEQAGEFHTSPATLDSGMVGVSGRLLTRGATTLRLKVEWALAQLDVSRAGTAFEAATMNMRRLRLGTEVSRERVFTSGVSLTLWGELGLCHDGGDGETGAGLELGGGLRYLDREAGLTVEGHGRWLTVHKGTLREWGFGALVRFAPRTGGRGPSVSLMPSWGETSSGVQRLWERGAMDPLIYDAPGARLEAQFGYGFTPFGGEGVLTPYGGVSFVREAARGYRLGAASLWGGWRP